MNTLRLLASQWVLFTAYLCVIRQKTTLKRKYENFSQTLHDQGGAKLTHHDLRDFQKNGHSSKTLTLWFRSMSNHSNTNSLKFSSHLRLLQSNSQMASKFRVGVNGGFDQPHQRYLLLCRGIQMLQYQSQIVQERLSQKRLLPYEPL